MARIPTVTTQIASRSGRTTQGVPSPQASPEAFGAGIGRGLQAMGAGLQDVATGLHVREEKRRQEEVANAVAQADFTRRELELRNRVGPDAAGYQEAVLDEYDQWVDEQAQGIEDDRARAEFTRRMQASRPGLSSRAAQYELGTAAEYSSEQANRSLTALDNRIRLQPDMYDELVSQGIDVINTRDNVPANVRAGMAERWRQNSAMARFEGMLEGANSVEDIDRIDGELRGEDSRWLTELAPNDLDRLLGTMSTARRAIRTQTDVQARAAIDSLEARASDPTILIPQDELRAAQQLVAASENPVTVARMARIVRDQQLVREYRQSTPAEMRAGGRDRAALGMLPQNRAALGGAGRSFGLSLEYMTRVAGTGSGDIGVYADAITSIESGGRYDAIGPTTPRGQRAYGRYQVMDFNIGPWTQRWLGRTMTPQEFLADPDAQDMVFAGQFGSYVEQYGNPVTAARAWFGFGESDGYTSGAEYERRFAAYVEQHSGGVGNGIDQDFIDRALATPGVRQRLAGDETPERVVAAYAAVARETMSQVLNREVSDEELYMAHRFGVEEATQIVRGYEEGDAEAVERYTEATREYAEAGPRGGVTASQYARQETLDRMAADARRRLAADPMTYAGQTGTFTISPLDGPGGFAARGDEARRVADYYRIPLDQMRPFTEDEAAAFTQQFANGSADDILEVLTAVQQMGGRVARAAMNQLDDVNDVYAYAGGLQLETGQGAVAADVVRGQRRLEENPDIRNQIGATERDISDAFMSATGGALMDAAPGQRQAIADAALAHYVETQVARGRAGRFNNDAFTASVQAVLGGRQGAPAVDEVNGELTVLPPGVTGREVEQAFNNMSVTDWAEMSEQGLPPRYVTGDVADPDDIADEARLRAIGGGRYRVMLSDGSYLVTGRPGQNGRLEAFIFTPTAERLQEVNSVAEERATARRSEVIEQMQRPDVSQQVQDVEAAMEDGSLTLEEQELLFQRYGPMWAYDENGNRIVPTQ